jgi:hypothetical protein
LRAKAEKLEAEAIKNTAEGVKLAAGIPTARQRNPDSRQGETNCERHFRTRGGCPQKGGSGGSGRVSGTKILRSIAAVGCGGRLRRSVAAVGCGGRLRRSYRNQ